jgi:hypothetical protein
MRPKGVVQIVRFPLVPVRKQPRLSDPNPDRTLKIAWAGWDIRLPSTSLSWPRRQARAAKNRLMLLLLLQGSPSGLRFSYW